MSAWKQSLAVSGWHRSRHCADGAVVVDHEAGGAE